MNERIKELLTRAGFSFDENGELNTLSAKRVEKFAELIVLECVNAVMDGTNQGDHYAQRIENHFDNGDGGILHFGVEE
jgi:hypothetical protein